ncbi:hypothetical protein Tco_0143463, partial [Tanacetum coccineum]
MLIVVIFRRRFDDFFFGVGTSSTEDSSSTGLDIEEENEVLGIMDFYKLVLLVQLDTAGD